MILRRLPLLSILASLAVAAACAAGFPDQDFLLLTLSQDVSSAGIVTVFQGQLDLDELPAGVRKQLMANGYEAGDMVPAICRMRESGENARCDFHVRRRPESAGDSGWWYIGTSRPDLYDNLAEWQQRKRGSGSGLPIQGRPK